MNRSLLFSALFFIVGILPVLAKPGVPLQFKVDNTNKENLGEITRYTVTITLTPLAKADRLSLDVKVPEGYRLLNGFKYWEGKVDARSTLSEKITLDGPTAAPLSLEVVATMHMGKAVSSKNSKVLLTPEEVENEKVYPQLDLEKSKAQGSEGRRIRRQ